MSENIEFTPNKKCNVLYITSLCNLNCDYCYEKENRDLPGFKHKTITKPEIDDFITEILEREGGAETNKTVSIFGGEAWLFIDLVEYALLQMAERLPNVGVDLLNNGTIFKDMETVKRMKKVFDYCYTKKVYPNFKFSFDGAGHDRRVYQKSGKSSKKDVIQAMDNALELEMPFAVSYTVHRENCEQTILLKDAIKIIKRYGKVLKLINLSFYRKEIQETMGVTLDEYKDTLRARAAVLFHKYKIPVCDLMCGTCQRCDHGAFEGNNYFIPEHGNEFRNQLHYGRYDHFDM